MPVLAEFAPAIVDLVWELEAIEKKVVTGYTLADAMREGCKVTEQVPGWGHGHTACALSAAAIGARARGLV